MSLFCFLVGSGVGYLVITTFAIVGLQWHARYVARDLRGLVIGVSSAVSGLLYEKEPPPGAILDVRAYMRDAPDMTLFDLVKQDAADLCVTQEYHSRLAPRNPNTVLTGLNFEEVWAQLVGDSEGFRESGRLEVTFVDRFGEMRNRAFYSGDPVNLPLSYAKPRVYFGSLTSALLKVSRVNPIKPDPDAVLVEEDNGQPQEIRLPVLNIDVTDEAKTWIQNKPDFSNINCQLILRDAVLCNPELEDALEDHETLVMHLICTFSDNKCRSYIWKTSWPQVDLTREL